MCREPSISKIEYWFIFCPRYMRKLFTDMQVCCNFKEKAKSTVAAMNLHLYDIKLSDDQVMLHISGNAGTAPADIVFRIKKETAASMREDISYLQNVKSIWTRQNYISTAKPTNKEIEEYRAMQKRRN